MSKVYCEYKIVEASFHFWSWLETNMGLSYIRRIWPEPEWTIKIQKKGVVREEHHFAKRYKGCTSPFNFWTGLDPHNREKVYLYYVNEMQKVIDEGFD